MERFEKWFVWNVLALKKIGNNLVKERKYIVDAHRIEDERHRIDVLIWNQNTLIQKVLETARDHNKWKEKPLRRFINQYILDLNLLNDNEFTSSIYYYLKLYEEFNVKGGSEKLDFDITDNPFAYTKREIFFELLFSNTYLPKYENQDQFNEEMYSLLERLENRLQKFMLNNSPIVFTPVEPQFLLNHMEDFNWYSLRWVQHIDKWILKKVWYYFSIIKTIDVHKHNEFYINAIADSDRDNWIKREEFVKYLREKLKLQEVIPDKEYVYKVDSLFKYTIYIWEGFNSWDIEYDENWFHDVVESYWFELKLYATPLRDKDPKEDFINVSRRLPILANELFLHIYEDLWIHNRRWRVWYPSKPVLFDISKILNAEQISWGEILPFSSTENSPITSLSWPDNPNMKFEFITVNYEPKLILNKQLKREIDIFVDRINNSDKYTRLWLDYPKWLIFHWPAGVWKTSIARMIAAKTNKKSVFLEVMIDKIKWMYVWESEKAARKLFADMRREAATWKVVIWFIDEIDGLMWSWEKKDDVDSGMRSVILSEMEWIIENKNDGIIFIWATNHLENISSAYVDRFDKTLEVALPNNDERRELIDMFMFKHWEEIFDDENTMDYDLLIKKTAETSPRFYKKWFINTVADYVFNWENGKISTKDLIDQIEITKSEIWDSMKSIWFIQD